jgi:RNA polymerase sigma factor (sigma-70 family)
LLERLGPRLRAVGTQYHLSPQETEDLRQDALMALVARWDEIEEPEAWLVGTFKHLCQKRVRSWHWRKLERVDPGDLERMAGAAVAAPQTLRLDLERLVRALPPRQRHLLRLYCLGLTSTEVNERLGARQAGSCNRDRLRAIARLRQLTSRRSPRPPRLPRPPRSPMR